VLAWPEAVLVTANVLWLRLAGYGSVESVSAHIGGRGNSDVSERWFTPAALPRHGLRANRSYSTIFIQPN
jgi:hypothetical protein